MCVCVCVCCKISTSDHCAPKFILASRVSSKLGRSLHVKNLGNHLSVGMDGLKEVLPHADAHA